jgi:hypothetical protein
MKQDSQLQQLLFKMLPVLTFLALMPMDGTLKAMGRMALIWLDGIVNTITVKALTLRAIIAVAITRTALIRMDMI